MRARGHPARPLPERPAVEVGEHVRVLRVDGCVELGIGPGHEAFPPRPVSPVVKVGIGAVAQLFPSRGTARSGRRT